MLQKNIGAVLQKQIKFHQVLHPVSGEPQSLQAEPETDGWSILVLKIWHLRKILNLGIPFLCNTYYCMISLIIVYGIKSILTCGDPFQSFLCRVYSQLIYHPLLLDATWNCATSQGHTGLLFQNEEWEIELPGFSEPEAGSSV